MQRIPTLFPGEVYPPVTPQSFTLSGKTAWSGYGVIGRLYNKPILQPDALNYKKVELFTSLGNPPDWPPNTTGTFTLSSKVNRVTNNLLGRIARTWYATIQAPEFSIWQSDGKTTCVFTSPTSTQGSFRADATGAATFEAEFLEEYWISQGYGHNTWVGYSDVASGWRANATATCNFNANATMLRMDAKSSASFNAIQPPAPTGWKATSKGGARFMGGVGQGEDCLTSDVEIGGRFPNFVY